MRRRARSRRAPTARLQAISTATASSMLVNSPVQLVRTFFALLGMQGTGDGSSSAMPWAQRGAGDASGGNNLTSAGQSWDGQSWGSQSWGGQLQQGQFGPPPFAGIGALLRSADAGATGQTATNANGSTTYTITYADGSTVALTTAAPSSGTSSAASSDAADSTSTASNNPLEQLIETLTQSLNAASTTGSADGTSSATQASATQGGQGQFGPLPFGDAAALQAAANSGATGQTTANANGSTTYTITYADGSSVTLTTPAASSSASSAASSSTADNTGSSTGNPLEQAIEMLAGALNSGTSQNAGNMSSGEPQSQFAPPPPFGTFGSMLAAADSGATSQTTTNANGSTTYAITYPDGSRSR